MNAFFCHYGTQLKTVLNRKRTKRFTDIDNNKRKKHYNLKVPRFCAVFNHSNSPNRRKHESYYDFPSIVKNNNKIGTNCVKLGKEK